MGFYREGMKCQYLQFKYLYFSSITYTLTNARHFCSLSGLMVLGLKAKTPPPGPTPPPGQATARPGLGAVTVVRRDVT